MIVRLKGVSILGKCFSQTLDGPGIAVMPIENGSAVTILILDEDAVRDANSHGGFSNCVGDNLDSHSLIAIVRFQAVEVMIQNRNAARACA